MLNKSKPSSDSDLGAKPSPGPGAKDAHGSINEPRVKPRPGAKETKKTSEMNILEDEYSKHKKINESGSWIKGGKEDERELGENENGETPKLINSSFTMKILDPVLAEGTFLGSGSGLTLGTSVKGPKKERKGKIQVKTTSLQGVREQRGPTCKLDMYNKFQPWVLSTYGDSAKTKTITRKKAARIACLLSAEKESLDPAGSEAAKFRLWVKSKGLQLAPSTNKDEAENENSEPLLIVPSGTDKTLDGNVHFVYKKVAVVEQFFDIIYSVHVESSADTQLRGRAGKHCGQKRTYRAVADQYAFIPREAVSRFLLYCTECQRKQPVPTLDTNIRPNQEEQERMSTPQPVNCSPGTIFSTGAQSFKISCSPTRQLESPYSPRKGGNNQQTYQNLGSKTGEFGDQSTAAAHAHAIAYAQAINALQSFSSPRLFPPSPSVFPSSSAFPPSTQMFSNSPTFPPSSSFFHPSAVYPNTSIFPPSPSPDNLEIDLSLPITSTYLKRLKGREVPTADDYFGFAIKKEDPESGEDASSDPTWANFSHKHSFSQSNIQNSSQSNLQNSSQSNLPLSNLGQYLAQNRNGSSSPSRSDITRDESIIGDDNSSVGNKDDDDDEDEDDGSDDKFDNSGDPERLKAFNMFVRLFVDENLDRHVPISKQPKEKIQAIIDSCTRQFPEFSDRARKRIRTYLKSCRRTKRSREQAGLDTNNRPTPPHLTSVHAEQMLARACENEAENAKRMRIGMEPISQPIPIPMSYCSPMDVVSGGSPVTVTMTMIDKTKMEYKPEQLTSLLATSQHSNMVPVSSMPVVNGATAAMYRQVLQQQQPTVYHSQPPGLLQGLGNTNGQGLESLKKPPLLNHKLNGTEMTAVRQLITGYRESAAFLLRSADELEHLIQIQPKL